MSDHLSLGGLKPRDIQQLDDVNLHESESISEEEDVWEEIDLSDPPKVWEKSRQVLPEKVDLSRVDSSLGLDEARQTLEKLPGKPWTETVTDGLVLRHPITDHVIRIPKDMIPTTIPSYMTKEEVTQFLQEKIDRGRQIVDKLHRLSWDLPEKTSLQDVTDVMWYLHAMAEYKAGAHWKEGAITIEDPGGRIREFLDKCEGHAYQRPSTHVEGFQSAPNGRPRGIDCYGQLGPDQVLPYGRQTILYQQMGTQTDQTPLMPRNMLFLKMEQYGCYSARQQLPDRGPTRQANPHDWGAFRGHVGTTIKSILRRLTGTNSPEGSRKERVSSGMQKAYDKLAKWHLFGSNLPSEVRTILQRNNPGNTASGVRVMKQNIDQAIAFLRDRPGSERHIAKLEAFAQKYFTNPQWDHMDLRIGNEVIFTQDDLEHPDRLSRAQGTTAQRLLRNIGREELIDRGQTAVDEVLNPPQGSKDYQDLQPTDNGVCVQFEKDAMTRGTLVIGGKTIERVKGEDPPGKSRLEALKQFFTNEEGELDEEGLLTASRLLNQATASIFVSVLEMDKLGEPALPGIPGISGNRITYDVSRDSRGQVRIRLTLDQDLLDLTNMKTGDVTDLRGCGGALLHQEVVFRMPGRGARPDQVEVLDFDYLMKTND